MSEIKRGDKAWLKSGSPPMTVGVVRGEDDPEVRRGEAQVGDAICAWFDQLYGCATRGDVPAYGAARSGEFHVDMLTKEPPT